MTLAHRVLPEQRRPQLRERLAQARNLRLIEAHSGLSALVGGTVQLPIDKNIAEFDGVWISSLTSSASRGLPDVEMYMLEQRLELVEEVSSVTSKIIIVDGRVGFTGFDHPLTVFEGVPPMLGDIRLNYHVRILAPQFLPVVLDDLKASIHHFEHVARRDALGLHGDTDGDDVSRSHGSRELSGNLDADTAIHQQPAFKFDRLEDSRIRTTGANGQGNVALFAKSNHLSAAQIGR